jgi:PhnB protein
MSKKNLVNIYLNFENNCLEAFEFYKSVFGGEFQMKTLFKEVPDNSNMFEEDEANKIMHITLPIGGDTVLMGSDSPKKMGPVNVGNNFSISVSPKSREEADRLYESLSQGGSGYMPLMDSFWGAYFGMLTDKYGINWMINFEE